MCLRSTQSVQNGNNFFFRSMKFSRPKGRTSKFISIQPNYESVDYPGMFIAGGASHSLDFRKSAGGFIHGYRYTGNSDVYGLYGICPNIYTSFSYKMHRLETRRSWVQPPAEVGNILSWRLMMKYFLRLLSPFHWFKKGSCQFLAKECAQYWLTAKRTKPAQ